MTGPVFVDANVLLYAQQAGEPRKRAQARAWLDHLWRTQQGRTSMQVLSEYYVNLNRRQFSGLSPDAAWDDAAMYLAWKPRAIDADLFVRARAIEQRFRISWWDSLVVAAAQLEGCAVLLTEDLQDGGVYGTVTVRSPFTLEVREPAAQYAVSAVAIGRHRPRGRPRRTAFA